MQANALPIISSTFPGWNWDHNYEFAERGRIWILWDPSLSVIVLKKTAQLVLCAVSSSSLCSSFSVAFIYGLHTQMDRRGLWKEISSLIRNSPARDHPCLLMGDFNQILSVDEHYSVIPGILPISGMADLYNCFMDNELSDLPSRGASFTWTNERPEDPITRKLDRAVGNDALLSTFPEAFAFFDSPGDSDHSPCLVTLQPSAQGSCKCFRCFSFLSTHPSFEATMLEAWQKQVCVGSKLFTFGQRLREAKLACKKLNRSGFGNIQQKTADALRNLEEIQASLLSSPSHSLFRQEFAARQKWNFFASAQESFYRQKSSVRWYTDGDASTSFYHRVVASNFAWNCIRYLRDSNDVKVDDPVLLKSMLISYYQGILGEEVNPVSSVSVQEIQSLMSYRCPEGLHSQLSAIPSVEEITEVALKMPKNKAPGPDGFSIEFFIEAWDIVGSDLVEAVRDFFITGSLPVKFNATAITLIPKVQGADSLRQFRPVSCCSTVYKIIARIIKRRLKLFIGDVIQMNQVGFLKDRLMCENVLLASELVMDFHLPERVTRGCLQVDLAKAFDSLNWDFLFKILEAIDLPLALRGWIKECVSTTSFSIAFNGELVGHFRGKKGLRQGDPISSLLFVLAMDVLSKKLDRGVVDNHFAPHPSCDAPLITHLSFADDVLIFFDGSERSVIGILEILEEFKLISGLGINKDKTYMFLDGGCFLELKDMAERLGLQQGSFPVRYLGLPLTSKKLRKQEYQPLLDKVLKRFTAWSSRKLSFAGRLVLIRTVIYSTITFWASVFLLPNSCLEELEHLCNAFLRKGSPHSARGAKISWKSICTPKESGGLGLRRLLAWNKVLGLKLI